MAIVTTHVALTSATDTELANGAHDEVFVKASATIFVGPSGVTASTGLPIQPTDPPFRIVLGTGEVLHGIAASRPGAGSTATAYVLKNT